MRKPGAGPDPTPLILSHRWPWTFWHWSKVIDDLLTHATIYWTGNAIRQLDPHVRQQQPVPLGTLP